VVVLPTPVLQHHTGFGQRPQLLTVQALLTQTGVEALDVAVLPRAPRLDVQRLDLVFRQPRPQLALDELAATVNKNELGLIPPLGLLNRLLG